jgi:hypothetical protein
MQGWIKEALLLGRFLSPFFEKIKGFLAAILAHFLSDYY